ncbi:MAG: thioredoxin domain-containing protein [Candidatus Melainabacteria bacterium]|nr:thioredoxin domain-containing protein [Candidatus Melainabacteria bacterium]
MKKINFVLITVLFVLSSFNLTVISNSDTGLVWIDKWSEDIFKQAKKENKFVLLDLEAIWCHWCHVMKEETYHNSDVQSVINEKFIPVRINQDSRPDLANKYRRYAWPATIIFNSDGIELIKRRGYIPPDQMKEELKKVISNPIPEAVGIDLSKISFSSKPILDYDVRDKLVKGYFSSLDSKLGGLKSYQKYLDRDTIEYSFLQSPERDLGDKVAQLTLNNALMLIDPYWGGVYQYSTMGGWDYPHFEKLASLQGEYLRIYSIAYSKYKNKNYLIAAKDIHKYLTGFLMSPEGVFYTSQDADLVQGEHSSEYFALNDVERRKQGIPKIDKNIYSNNNGLIIEGLVALYRSTNNKQYLDDATNTANWIIKNHKMGDGFISALGWILEDLFDPELIFQRIGWIIKDKHFYNSPAGFATSASSCEICAVSGPTLRTDENIKLARFSSQLYSTSYDPLYKTIAEHTMKYLVTPNIALSSVTEPGILIAEREFIKSLLGLS